MSIALTACGRIAFDPFGVAGDGGTDSVSGCVGDGTFRPQASYTAGSNPADVTVGQFGGDAAPDIAVTNLLQMRTAILINNGDGTLAAPRFFTTGVDPSSVDTADFDSDGLSDLVVANLNGDSVSVLKNLGGGDFAPAGTYATGNRPYSVVARDFSGDAIPDLAVVEFDDAMSHVWFNNGTGSFQAPMVAGVVGLNPISIASGDVDNDGDLDLVTANNGGNSFNVIQNLGPGTWMSNGTMSGGGPFHVALANLDGANLDVIVSTSAVDALSIHYGNGAGGFAPAIMVPAGTSPRAAAAGDFDGDGDLDLAAASFGDNAISVIENTGSFGAPVSYAADNTPSSIATADLDGDGALDLVAGNTGGQTVSVYLANCR
ncbi:MAG TPA: VCBS repeat-containing protein [Kofleriaceae bacterium]